MGEIELRPGDPGDALAIATLVWGDPEGETASLTGGVERALAFGRLVEAASHNPAWTESVVAVKDGAICGVVQQGSPEAEFQPGARFVMTVAKAWGPRGVTLLPRGIALQRVRIGAPAGSWVVRELQVRSELRGQGIGGMLLDRAEEDARRTGRSLLALTTRTNNPARHLYERKGFQLVSVRTHRSYQRLTGAEGRILMTKPLE